MHNTVPQFILDKYARRQWQGAFEAVALHLDIIGFTPATEELIQHGQEGAEILAGMMQTIFEPLTEIINGQGGFITRLQGDAFTALFEAAEDAPQRALAAAREIQQRLQQAASQKTDLGLFIFSGRIGLAQGKVRWHILPEGADQEQHPLFARTYYFRGSTIYRCLQAESMAPDGGLVIGPRLHPFLAERLEVSPLKTPIQTETYYQVQQIHGPFPPATPAAAGEIETASHFTPPILRHRVSDGEFRNVLTLFVHLAPTEDESGGSAPSRLIPDVMRRQRQYGGYLDSIEYDGQHYRLLFFWGAPVSYENNIERALTFILELRQALAGQMRAGVTYQLMYAGFIHTSRRRQYVCYGRGINLADRQMTAAGWNEVWLDEATARRASLRFSVAAREPVDFKGFNSKMPVTVLIERRPEAPSDFFRYQLAGRETELGLLSDAVRPLFEGRFAGVIAIVGEAGIGKSRLLHEFEQLCRFAAGRVPAWGKTRWLHCQTDEIFRHSLNPFRYFLRRYFNQDPTLNEQDNKSRFAEVLNELLQSIESVELSQELRRTRSMLGALVDLHWPGSLYEILEPRLRFENSWVALQSLLKAESLRQPIILAIEDTQWLDGDSVEYLRRLAHALNRSGRGISGYPLAILVTSRHVQPNWLTDPALHSEIIALRSLPEATLTDLARHILGQPVHQELIQFLHQKTDGNPLFAEQLLYYLQEHKLLQTTATGVKKRSSDPLLPTDIRATLIARLDRLPRPVQQIIQTAAVLGREFELPILREMLTQELQLKQGLAAAEKAGIWSPINRQRYIFNHALLRDAAYDMQSRARLRQLHRLAARAITRRPSTDFSAYYASLAYHLDQAGEKNGAVLWYQRAGTQAAEKYANSEALTYLDRALSLNSTDFLKQQYELLLAREKIYSLQGNRELQGRDLEALHEIAGRLDSAGSEEDNGTHYRAEVALRLASFGEVTADYAMAAEAAQKAIQLGESDTPGQTRTAGYLALGRVLMRWGKFDESLQMLATSLELAESADLPKLAADGRRTQGIVAFFLGNMGESRQNFSQALDIYRRLGDLRGESAALNNLAILSADQGDYQTAGETFAQALQLYRETGDREGQGLGLGNLGEMSTYQGDFRYTQEYYEQSLAICREINNRQFEANALSNLGNLTRQLGSFSESEEYLQQALAVYESIDDRNGQGMAKIRLSRVYAAQDRLEEATAAAQGAAEIALSIASPPMQAQAWRAWGDCCKLAGDWAVAREKFEQALRTWQELGQQGQQMAISADLAHAELLAGRPQEALAIVEPVINFMQKEGLDGNINILRVYHSCWTVLDSTGDTRAGQLLQEAYDLLQERAATITAGSRRRAYRENVAVNRAILAAWENRKPAGASDNRIR